MEDVQKFSDATIAEARELRVIDDALFRLIAKNTAVCQEILRTLLDDENLVVIEANTQYTIVSLNRELVLDALCKLGDGTYCNIEMQKSDSNNDIKRVRYHAAAVTTDKTLKGTAFDNIPNVKILYVTEYDALNNGKAITYVSRCQYVNDEYLPLNDGEDIIFANTCCKEDTMQSKLLSLFLRKDSFFEEQFPELSKVVQYYKGTKEGEIEMCKSIEEFAASRALEEGLSMLAQLNIPLEQAIKVAKDRHPELSEEFIKEKYLALVASFNNNVAV